MGWAKKKKKNEAENAISIFYSQRKPLAGETFTGSCRRVLQASLASYALTCCRPPLWKPLPAGFRFSPYCSGLSTIFECVVSSCLYGVELRLHRQFHAHNFRYRVYVINVFPGYRHRPHASAIILSVGAIVRVLHPPERTAPSPHD